MNFANWKTTVGGGLTAALGILSLLGVKIAGTQPVDPQNALAMITAGIGIMFSKDFNVTGGTTKQ